jgi:hypothetical protein
VKEKGRKRRENEKLELQSQINAKGQNNSSQGA